jgi:GMP synthase-like glutamine amidotransferase
VTASPRPALVRQHGDTDPPGILAEWARARGIPLEVSRSDLDGAPPELEGRPFVASLGSARSPNEIDVPAVRAELELLEQALRGGVPVLGLCFGGQALAKLLGGEVEPAAEPELGWYRVATEDPELIGEGPWLQWHYERFTLPPGARPLAHTPVALQAFAYGPHLALQFHPEATPEVVCGWARKDRPRLEALGIEDGEERVERGRQHAAAARRAALALFDAFWRRAQEHDERSRR